MDFVVDIASVEKDFNQKLRNLRSVPADQQEAGLRVLAEELSRYSDSLQDVKSEAAQYYKAKVQASVAKLRANLAGMRRVLIPRRKFSFASRKLLKKVETAEKEIDQIPSLMAAIVVKELEGQIVKDNRGGSAAIHDLNDCLVLLTGSITALYIERCKNTVVVVGSVGGGARVEFCDCCHFRIGCHQLRIHDTANSTFLSSATTSPIIERCSGLKMAFENGGCETVLDFSNPNAVVSTCWERAPTDTVVETFSNELVRWEAM